VKKRKNDTTRHDKIFYPFPDFFPLSFFSRCTYLFFDSNSSCCCVKTHLSMFCCFQSFLIFCSYVGNGRGKEFNACNLYCNIVLQATRIVLTLTYRKNLVKKSRFCRVCKSLLCCGCNRRCIFRWVDGGVTLAWVDHQGMLPLVMKSSERVVVTAWDLR
jgi:hypothetical protein